MKKILILITFLILGVGSIFIYKRGKNTPEAPYKTETPQVKDLNQVVNSSGTLQVSEQITVGSLITGRVVKILADNNDRVKKGQVLAELDNGIGYSGVKFAKAVVDQAKAELEYSKAFFARQKQLYDVGQISQDEYERYTKDLETAQAKLASAKADLEIKEQQYNNLFIKSPDDGIVIAKKVDLGQQVTAELQATELFVIGKDLTRMEVKINVDESDIGKIKEGQEATFKVDAFPKEKFAGKIKRIQFLAQTIENVVTFPVILEVPNKDMRLRPGMTANIDIAITSRDDVLSIPNKALRINRVTLEKIAVQLKYPFVPSGFHEVKIVSRETNGDTVWVEKDKNFVETKVTLGATDNKFSEVISGINANDKIVIEVQEPKEENPLLKQVFGNRGIGAK